MRLTIMWPLRCEYYTCQLLFDSLCDFKSFFIQFLGLVTLTFLTCKDTNYDECKDYT